MSRKSALGWHQDGTMLGQSKDQVDVLMQAFEEKEIAVLMNSVGRSNRTKFREQVGTKISTKLFNRQFSHEV